MDIDLTMTPPWTDVTLDLHADPDLEAQPVAVNDIFETHSDILQSAEAVILRRAGLRPTCQRVALSRLLFSHGERHVTADLIYAEAIAASISISLATVYNTLNQFTDAGLLKRIGLDGSKSFFDTNLTAHHHFFVDQEDMLLDLPEPEIELEHLPQPLPGYEVAKIDVVIHLRRKQA